METNYLILLVVGVLAIWLVVYLIRQNKKDEKAFEKEANLENPDEESEINNDDTY